MTLTVPAPCSKCHADATEVCQMCHGPMCVDHISSIDPLYCNACISSEPTCIGISESPLTDEENVTHEGRLIHPTGEAYKTIPSAIAEMSDAELSIYIDNMKAMVKQAESTTEYRRIALGTATLEQDGRAQAARRRLRGIKVVSAGSRTINANAKGPAVGASAAKIAGVVEKLKTAGIDLSSPDKMAAFMDFLKHQSTGKIAVPPAAPTAKAEPTPQTAPVEPPVVLHGEQPVGSSAPEPESEFDRILREEQDKNGN